MPAVENTPIHKDWMMSGLLAGMAVSALKSLAGYGLIKAGIPVLPYGTTAGAVVFARRRRFFGLFPARRAGRLEDAVGHATDIAFGGFLGSVVSYVLGATPPGNEAVKTAAMVSGISAATVMTAKLMDISQVDQVTPAEFTSNLVLSGLFGLTVGTYFARYGSHVIRESHPKPVKIVSDEEFNKNRLEITPYS